VKHDPGKAIGRTRAPIVLSHGATPRAYIGVFTARIRPARGGQRLRIRGSVGPDPTLRAHLADTVLPLIDALADLLHLPVRRLAFEITLTNCGAASLADRGLRISGFSADTAVFLALLSALLKLPLPQDIVSTGHLRSTAGEFGPVSGLDLKLEAACRTPGLRKLVYAAFDDDGSVEAFAPDCVAKAHAALNRARDRLHLVAVSDVCALLHAVCDEQSIVRASLSAGFFAATPPEPDASPVARAAAFLTHDLPARFWRVLDGLLFVGDIAGAQLLLAAWVQYHVRRGAYPLGCGRQFLGCLAAQPVGLLEVRGAFPLLPPRACLALVRLATPADYEDVQLLQRAVAEHVSEARSASAPAAAPGASAADTLVTAVLDELSAQTLATRIGLPIDAARAALVPPCVTTDDPDVFDQVFTGFYVLLLRYLGLEPGAANIHCAAEALALLERTFARDGGLPAARAEAATGIHGGLRFLLDRATEQFKHEQQMRHIRQVIETAVNARSWDQRLAFTRAWYRRLQAQLPPDLQNLPEDHLTHDIQHLLETYVQSTDRVVRALRCL